MNAQDHDPRVSRPTDERIAEQLRGIGRDYNPPAGWENRVIDATAPARRSLVNWFLWAVSVVSIIVAIGLAIRWWLS